MPYKIDVGEVGEYIEYLKKVRRKLENDLSDFDKAMKEAHNSWDDNNYTLTMQAKEKVAAEQRKLIESIDKSIKKLRQMHEDYERYLNRR